MGGGAGSVWSSSLERIGDVVVVFVGGEIDLDTAPKLERVLAGLPRAQPVIVDCSRVEYFDLAGVHVLEHLYARSAVRRSIVLADLPPHVRRVLELAGLTRTLRVAATVDEALAMLGAGAESDETD
ncbi:MAG TPA: STAS domain-containing protein [bacterium]|jgi:anti-anti-sigma factor|nr:STAS domain-containing protein [bacterium]